MSEDELLVVGKFGAPIGVRGEIRVVTTMDPPGQILELMPWQIGWQGKWEAISFTPVSYQAGRLVVKLAGYTSREQVAALTNVPIAILRSQLPILAKGEYYWAELIGLRVVNLQNLELGVVKNLIATGANDVLEVVGEQRRLIPYLSTIIKEVDLVGQIIWVDWDESF